ncbi:FMN reductase [Shewanella sairae]|uniref:FMN reductase n=1 Tax=Shewanella sairae TaxID=190310 RepID=A0ABQ4P2B0_9GAMM|nr:MULTISPECIES: NAD(P)H-dependent oxidoreductase [Shewanella]MCK8043837.1 NAD(P)H-dependent oxidoreductase [Shewanella sp. 1CM18E]MCL1128309.1 NAD(P)H-dependent oxidoreductase [Shewanella sairae]GIU41642.1 FMN reductase [Shewanella sairae]
MELVIVSASQRSPSQSAKVGRYLKEQNSAFTKINHIELSQYQLPFWDGDPSSKSADGSQWPLIAQQIKRADALVLITPEWAGTASPLMKNFLLMSNSQDTAHKPALLVGVASGINGAYPIAELRMNAFKNNKLVPTPDHLIIRDAENVLNGSQPQSDRDLHLRQRIDYSLHMLAQYSTALKSVRINHQQQVYPNQQEYSYGM